MLNRTQKELTDDDIRRVADTYHAWRGAKKAGNYEDTPGFCKSATLDEIGKHGHVLTPGRYVGAEDGEEDDEPFDDKLKRLTAQLDAQLEEGGRLEKVIKDNLKGLGYGS